MNEQIAVMSEDISQFKTYDDTNKNKTADQPQFSEAEIKSALQNKVWYLRFPARLEKNYLEYAHKRAIKKYRFNGLFALGVFVVIFASVFKLIPASSFWICLKFYFFALSIMVGVRIFSFFRRYDRWFYWYVTTSAIIMVTIAVYVNNAIYMGTATTLSYIALTYILFFIYCMVGLRPQLALLANVVGGVFGIWLTYDLGSHMDWQTMPPTFATASFLAMFLAYGLGRQERISFLQSYLLKLALEKSEKLSREDTLTGLANRRYLNEMMAVEWNRMLRQKQPLAIIMIDIDFFKRYNDSLGHLAGDKCLHQVAQLISEEAKRGGELAARYGGEEFVLLFPDMDEDLAKQQVERLLARVNKAAIPHPDSDLKIVTVSVGISVCVPQPSMTVDQQLRHADDALYRAKANGKNRYEFFE